MAPLCICFLSLLAVLGTFGQQYHVTWNGSNGFDTETITFSGFYASSILSATGNGYCHSHSGTVTTYIDLLIDGTWRNVYSQTTNTASNYWRDRFPANFNGGFITGMRIRGSRNIGVMCHSMSNTVFRFGVSAEVTWNGGSNVDTASITFPGFYSSSIVGASGNGYCHSHSGTVTTYIDLLIDGRWTNVYSQLTNTGSNYWRDRFPVSFNGGYITGMRIRGSRHIGQMCHSMSGTVFHFDGIYCSRSLTCNSHGSCDTYGFCFCDVGYAGESCNQCDTNYFVYPSCRYCVPDDTCNGHGVCDSSGYCVCYPKYEGSNCERCESGWVGYPDCRSLDLHQFEAPCIL